MTLLHFISLYSNMAIVIERLTIQTRNLPRIFLRSTFLRFKLHILVQIRENKVLKDILRCYLKFYSSN